MVGGIAQTVAPGSSVYRVRFLERRAGSAISLPALVAAACIGSAARLLVDETIEFPTLAAFVVAIYLAVLLLLDGRAGMLPILILPGLFGAAPWNSPVRAYFGPDALPLYFFDAVILLTGAIGFLEALFRTGSVAHRFLRENWLAIFAVIVLLVAKIAQARDLGEAARNAAEFYYFPAIGFTLTYIGARIDLRRLIPWLYLEVLPALAIVPAIVVAGIMLGQRELVLDEFGRQGIVTPAGILAWFPPGSLVLLSFLSAAFLFERRAPAWSRVAIGILLTYDAVTYGNRALWVAIAVGIGVHWLLRRGWKGLFLTVAMLAVMTLSSATIREVAAEGHNNSSEWRLLVWGLTAFAIADSPITGHSYDISLLGQVLPSAESQFAIEEAGMRVEERARSPHNSYLSLLFFGGIVQGGAIMAFLGWTLIRLALQLMRRERSQQRSWFAESVFRGAVACAAYAAFNVVLESPIEAICFWLLFFTAWFWTCALQDELDRRKSAKLIPLPQFAAETMPRPL